MEMKKRVAIAKKKRAKLLAEYIRRDCTIQLLADKYGVTHARMWIQLSKAKKEAAQQEENKPKISAIFG